MSKTKVKKIESLLPIINALKKEGKKIITTNGVFDILHVGHIRYLQEAKALGDILIVAINEDSSVKRLKGEARPLNSQEDRAEALAALECVDFVTFFSEDTPIELLEKIKPDIHTKGGDYQLDQIVEKEVVEQNKGKIVILREVGGFSTTNLINKILSAYKK